MSSMQPPPTPTPALDALLSMFSLAPRNPALIGKPIRTLLRIAVLLTHFPLLRVKPLLVFAGWPGSGKTTLARIVGRLRMGLGFQVGSIPREVRDWVTGLARGYYSVIDNVERPPTWFAAEAAKVCTGGTWEYRKLYSNDQLTTISPNTYLAVTTATPSWLTGFLLDRSLVFRLGACEPFIPEEEIEKRLNAAYAAVSIEIRTVWSLVESWASGGLPQVVGGRLADVASYGYLLAEATEGTFGGGQIVLDALAGMQDERLLMAQDHDDTLGALLAWCAGGGAGRWVTAGQLIQELAGGLGGQKGFDFLLRDPARMGRWLAELRERIAGIVTWDRRTYHGRSEYQFALARPLPVEPEAEAAYTTMAAPSSPNAHCAPAFPPPGPPRVLTSLEDE